MSYAIGSKSNTRGRTAATLLCLLCGSTLRTFNPEVAYGVCRPCRGPGSWPRTAAMLDALEPAVDARFQAYEPEERARIAAETDNPYTIARVARNTALRRAWNDVVREHYAGVSA